MADLPLSINLVSQAPELHSEWFSCPVLTSQIGEGSVSRGIAILHPVRRLFECSGAKIHTNVWFCVKLAAVVDKFMRAEMIAFFLEPGGVVSARAILLGTNSIHPVVSGSEITAGPTKYRHAPIVGCVENIFAKPFLVG